MTHVHWTRHSDRRWGVSRTLDGPGIVLFLGRHGLAFTWGEWS